VAAPGGRIHEAEKWKAKKGPRPFWPGAKKASYVTVHHYLNVTNWVALAFKKTAL